MPNKELVARMTARITELTAKRDAATAAIQELADTSVKEGRSVLNEDETARYTALTTERTAHIAGLEEARARVAELITEDERDAAHAETIRKYEAGFGGGTGDNTGGGETRAQVTEPATYRNPKLDRKSPSFFRDLRLAQTGNLEAAQRLQRNNAETIERRAKTAGMSVEQYRALTTVNGAGGEFVPPLWMEDRYIKVLRAGRVTAGLITNDDVPPGTDSINLPKIATGTAVASQATQNSSVQITDITTTSVAAPVVTLAGGQNLAMQLVEQSPINIDGAIFDDLVADYNRQLNTQVLNGSGASNQLKGLLNWTNVVQVAYTDASPAVAGAGKFLSKLADSLQRIHGIRFQPADAIIMTPRRWGWIEAAVDTQNRPLIVPSGANPMNAAGTSGDGATVSQGYVGNLFGIPVYVDATLPTNLGAGTNQDPVLVMYKSDQWLFEGSLKIEAFPQTFANNLTLFLRLYNYASLISRYDNALVEINGTGLIAPTF